ncbi:hypothetical protein L207DRAFT_537071 [Hyaloscypha variabilis F]|uniref:MADS-box domain-containing protein n=1 Tax=Hyaloscypha variabilis (strain UAMH 11265 / GT02V1 / F) TaxID=1149755 RepID=A0A2J6QZB6_HYAVF|nr:hypothetical protein L207DRAFT_537071 [Hyaloscypha variabilis F]
MASQEIRPRTLKERNTQRSKRIETMELKVAEVADLCDFTSALIMRNRESGEIYSFISSNSFQPNIEDILAYPKSRNKLPRDIEKIKRKKERQRLRGMRKLEDYFPNSVRQIKETPTDGQRKLRHYYWNHHRLMGLFLEGRRE